MPGASALHKGTAPVGKRPPKFGFWVDDVVAVSAALLAREAKLGKVVSGGGLSHGAGKDPDDNPFRFRNDREGCSGRRAAIERAPSAWSDATMIPSRPFYFLRHGQTDWNLAGRYQGHTDIPLNRAGIAQAHAAAECLVEVHIDRIVVSPLIRAVATAAIVAERLGKPIQIERGLVERNFGSFNGLVVREVKARHGLRPDQSSRDILPPDADPFHEIFERVPPVIAGWMRAHPQELLLFVAHSGVFDALHQHLLGPRSGRESGHAVPYLAKPIPGGWDLEALPEAISVRRRP